VAGKNQTGAGVAKTKKMMVETQKVVVEKKTTTEMAEMTAQYAPFECWSGAVTVAVAAAVAALKGRFNNEHPTCQNFRNTDWVRAHGSNYITRTYCNQWRAQPNDAVRALVMVANNMPVMTDGTTLATVVGFGKHCPTASKAIAGLRFETIPGSPVGHWTAVVLRDGNWCLIDGTKVSRAQSLASVCYWMYLPDYKIGGACPVTPQPAELPSKKKMDKHSLAAATPGASKRRVKPSQVPKPQQQQQQAAAAPEPKQHQQHQQQQPQQQQPQQQQQQQQQSKPQQQQQKTAPVAPAPCKQAGTKGKPTKPEVSPPASVKSVPAAPANGTATPVQAPVVVKPQQAQRGRPRTNQLGAIAQGFAGSGALPKNASKRDCGIASAIWMLISIVQATNLLDTTQGPTQRPPEGARAIATWRSLFEHDDAAVDAVREAVGCVASATGERPLTAPRDILDFFRLGLIDLGADAVRADKILGGGGSRTVPLDDALNGDDDFIVCLPTEAFERLQPGIVDIGVGARARVEAVIMTSHPRADDAEAGRHFWTIIRQRASQQQASKDDAFQRFDDAQKSAVTSLKRSLHGHGSPHIVLLRIVNRGACKDARIAATSSTEHRTSAPSRADAAPSCAPITDIPVADIVDGAMPVADALQRFQLGRSSFPLAAQMTGKHLKALHIHCEWKKPAMTIAGLSHSCRRRHRQLLIDFQRAIIPAWEQLPLGDAAVLFIQTMKRCGKRKAWCEATTHRNMAALAGAFSQLPIYSDFPSAIDLGHCAVWKAAMRSQEITMKMAEPVNQPAMDYDAVNKAVQAAMVAGRRQIAVAIMLTWLCAGRVGDATQLRPEDFTFSSICETTQFQRVRILVRRGKAAKLAQPHTIYSIVPPLWLTEIKALFATVTPSAPIFNRATGRDWGKLSTAITTALRTANPQFGHRALRRGALQTLASDPTVDDATLRTFSGHTTDETLMRYLNWGLQSNRRAVLAQSAASNLFPVASSPATTPATTSPSCDDDTDSTTSSAEQLTTTRATSATFPSQL
jgi:integrase